VLGALNALTHELVMITNDTYITADSVLILPPTNFVLFKSPTQ